MVARNSDSIFSGNKRILQRFFGTQVQAVFTPVDDVPRNMLVIIREEEIPVIDGYDTTTPEKYITFDVHYDDIGEDRAGDFEIESNTYRIVDILIDEFPTVKFATRKF